jgi:hypothetical protein
MNSRGYGTNLAASYGANQNRPTSAALLDSNAMSSRNALSGTATPPGSLAELKLKAKESILAKKAQNVRSSSHETSVQINGTDSTIAESLTRNDTSKTPMEAAQNDSLHSDERSLDPTKSKLSFPTAMNSQNPATDAFKVSSHPVVNHNLVPPRDNNSGGVKASSVELEDLLAEGRAAAEEKSRVVPGSTGFRSGPERRIQATFADTAMPPDQTGTETTAKYSASRPTASNEVPQRWEISDEDRNETDGRNERFLGQPRTRQVPAIPNQEKIERDVDSAQENPNVRKLPADREIDVSDAPKPEAPAPQTLQFQFNKPSASQEQIETHENNVARGQYNVEDVEEWLAMTGFYDEVYRQKVLNRRRRMKAIEKERLQLLLEEQADHDQRSQLARSHSMLAANTAPMSPFLARASSALPMPASVMAPSATQDLGLRIKDSALKNEKPLVATKTTETSIAAGSLKRRNSLSSLKEEEGQPRKVVRTESEDHEAAPPVRVSDKSFVDSPLTRHQSPLARTESFVEEQYVSADTRREGDVNANLSMKRRYDQWVPDRPAVYEDHRRSSHDSRNVRSFDSDRRANRPAFNSGHRHSDHQNHDHRLARYGQQDRFRRESLDTISPTKAGINLRVDNVRYFLIKSWNYENIETAQRECTWCTQTKNEQLFVDAFKNSSHVILIFSANNSHAFQGYARMQCLPGEPGVADPTWRKYLHWPTTKPFKIRWITKGDSSYRVAGNLRNPLNDDSMVFVGRDGQEIPDRVGLELCEALDQDAKYKANRLDH